MATNLAIERKARVGRLDQLRANCRALGQTPPVTYAQLSAYAAVLGLPRIQLTSDLTMAWLDEVLRYQERLLAQAAHGRLSTLGDATPVAEAAPAPAEVDAPAPTDERASSLFLSVRAQLHEEVRKLAGAGRYEQPTDKQKDLLRALAHQAGVGYADMDRLLEALWGSPPYPHGSRARMSASLGWLITEEGRAQALRLNREHTGQQTLFSDEERETNGDTHTDAAGAGAQQSTVAPAGTPAADNAPSIQPGRSATGAE
jgi:hypothetical protein